MEKYDLSLLAPYSSQLPYLAASFERACAVAPEERLSWAKAERKKVFRDGWFVNTPAGANDDGETVEDHVGHLKQLIGRYFPAGAKRGAALLAEYHDDHETLAHAVINGVRRDLNPLFNRNSYAISIEDKKIIEGLAREVLFEDAPGLKSLVETYKDSSGEAAVLFSGLDKICVMWRCVDLVAGGKYAYGDFQAYWDYWTPENVRNKCPGLIAEIYESDLWPRAQSLRR